METPRARASSAPPELSRALVEAACRREPVACRALIRRYQRPVASLLSRMLGMEVPVSALPRWLQAGVVAREDVREVDAVGRPRRIVEQGWQIRYPGYASDDPDALPRIIELSRGDAHLKLILDAWQ